MIALQPSSHPGIAWPPTVMPSRTTPQCWSPRRGSSTNSSGSSSGRGPSSMRPPSPSLAKAERDGRDVEVGHQREVGRVLRAGDRRDAEAHHAVVRRLRIIAQLVLLHQQHRLAVGDERADLHAVVHRLGDDLALAVERGNVLGGRFRGESSSIAPGRSAGACRSRRIRPTRRRPQRNRCRRRRAASARVFHVDRDGVRAFRCCGLRRRWRRWLWSGPPLEPAR